MGVTTWVKTSNMLRRLSWGHLWQSEDEQEHQGSENGSEKSRNRTSATRRKEVRKMPMAVTILDDPNSVNSQQACHLFTKLPAELRELIWDYALSRHEDLDFLYPLDKPYSRPGQAAPSRIDLALLLTCRAVYLETFLVPFQVNSMVVFDGHPEAVPPGMPLQCTPWNLHLCSKLRPWQFANIKSVDMNVQQFMLESGSLQRISRLVGTKGRHDGHEADGFTLARHASFRLAKEPSITETEISPRAETRRALTRSIFMGKKITHLTLRLSHTDWWSWTSCPQAGEHDPHEALRLEPMVNITERHDTSSAMRTGYEARKAGREPEFGLDEGEMKGRWGMQIMENWPDLQSLELVLETYVKKEEQLDRVVECAKLWTFPLKDGMRLGWDGKEKSRVRWRGAHKYGYDTEIGISWPNDSSDSRSDGADFTEWRPGTDNEDGQEFVIRTITYRRQRTP